MYHSGPRWTETVPFSVLRATCTPGFIPFIWAIRSMLSIVPVTVSTVAGLYILWYPPPIPQPPLPLQPLQGPAIARDADIATTARTATPINAFLFIVPPFPGCPDARGSY